MTGDAAASEVRIGDAVVRPGQRRRVELFIGRLPTQTPLNLPVEIVNGTRQGPRLWLSAAIHGDELNGVEIIHRVLDRLAQRRLRGEVIAAPIVNVVGFVQQERYLPDRRDLNRCFPGSRHGSLASRIAHHFMQQIVGHCTHGIDLHTASNHRINLPQVRGNLQHGETRRCAEAFGAPVMVHGASPRGSLRQAVARRGIPIIVYEAGEPQRFNADAIDMGVKGVLRVMRELGMIRSGGGRQGRASRIEVDRRRWVRARRSGLLRLQVKLGRSVTKGDTLGTIHDAFGGETSTVAAPVDGLVIGHTNNPMVYQGDAIIHLGKGVNHGHTNHGQR